MPRIEIVPAGWEDSSEKRNGEGTPTEDVCRDCAHGFEEGELLTDTDASMADGYPPGSTIGSVDVLHPPFAECGYQCSVCGAALSDEDD